MENTFSSYGTYLALLIVKQVFQAPESVIEDIAGRITGLETARRNIWIGGAIGAGIGLIAGAVTGRRRA